MPAQLTGDAPADLPTIQLVAGPMSTSRHRGERLGACTDCRILAAFSHRRRGGTGIAAVKKRLASTAGAPAQ